MSGAVVFISTAWGSKFGGINSFNKDIVEAMSSILCCDTNPVFCVVPSATSEDISQAKVHGVELVTLDESSDTSSLPSERAYEIKLKFEKIPVSWWIGHDVKTGPVAIKLKEIAGGKVSIIHHMDYSAYLPLYPEATQKNVRKQRDLLRKGDIVFAVGPKLTSSAKDKLRSEACVKVVELIPGLADVEGLKTQNKFTAIAFGRLGLGQDRLKQAKLCVAAFGEACRCHSDLLGNDATLTVIGLTDELKDEERAELQKLLDSSAGRAVPLHGWGYMDDREALLDELRQHSVCLMLSLHEGFGLVGWEAIAAEVPLIISENTGVYEYVSKNLGGVGRGCLRSVKILGSVAGEQTFREEDVVAVANEIISVRADGEGAKSDARMLKALLSVGSSWKATAHTIARECSLKVLSNFPHDRLASLTPDLLMDALKKGSGVVEEASRRNDYFKQIWHRLSLVNDISDRIVLFGGVSQALCQDDALEQFIFWLKAHPNGNVYLCHEVGEAAAARANKLNEKSLEKDHCGLSPKAYERMLQKQKLVESTKERVLGLSGDNGVYGRFKLVPINKPLYTYVIIADKEVYLTPLSEERATNSLCFSLSPNQSNSAIGSILYHLQCVEPQSDAISILVGELLTAFGKE